MISRVIDSIKKSQDSFPYYKREFNELSFIIYLSIFVFLAFGFRV